MELPTILLAIGLLAQAEGRNLLNEGAKRRLNDLSPWELALVPEEGQPEHTSFHVINLRHLGWREPNELITQLQDATRD